ncbi:hypothetical protein [Pasteurella multocida]|uniref:hypothetical protein n=1 Tax=Pasteurella multocida TaxID=747 RepID=UPI0029301FA7|nr:hypothetical protein [Pasteurella multocida]WNY75974.1 hypothetical protein H2513_08840 [Pasteurella multocida]
MKIYGKTIYLRKFLCYWLFYMSPFILFSFSNIFVNILALFLLGFIVIYHVLLWQSSREQPTTQKDQTLSHLELALVVTFFTAPIPLLFNSMTEFIGTIWLGFIAVLTLSTLFQRIDWKAILLVLGIFSLFK